jgi:hypothetical protein
MNTKNKPVKSTKKPKEYKLTVKEFIGNYNDEQIIPYLKKKRETK